MAPATLLSFCFYQLTRWVAQILAARHLRRKPEQAAGWQMFSKAFIEQPGALPFILTSGPRWNPHAVIATAGPLRIERRLEIEISTARAAAEAWFFVVYSYPDRRTIGTISCLQESEADWQLFTVPAPGQYSIVARFYNPGSSALCPKVRVDGKTTLVEASIPADANAFYSSLKSKTNCVYYCLAFHVYGLLRLQHWLPSSFVERIYLPVGNPETHFEYGAIERGEQLRLLISPRLLETHFIYVTIYSLDSLPLLWYEISEPEHMSAPCPSRGFYLVRLQPRNSRAAQLDPRERNEMVSIRTATPDALAPAAHGILA